MTFLIYKRFVIVLTDPLCYGRLTVVSDVDGVRVCPECQWQK
jgi:hypothetical protein